MLKKLSLVEGGAIDPSQWQIERVKQEIANLFRINPQEIERIDYWSCQICVKIIAKGAKFVSYRSLPLWFEEGLTAIANCKDVVEFEKLGAMLRYEMENHSKHYPPEILLELQQAWANKSPQFQTEEAKLQLKIAHQKEAEIWKQSWQQLLANCQDKSLINDYYWKIERESQQFADFPTIVRQVNDLWEEQREKFDTPDDFWTPF
ncbi:MAG: hypothetical protein ACRC2R_14060 [Xenococcaceae cyanobacterium]